MASLPKMHSVCGGRATQNRTGDPSIKERKDLSTDGCEGTAQSINCLVSSVSQLISNPDKPENKKIFYHEITKVRNHEKDHKTFRVFQISCFRDCFYFFATKDRYITFKGLKAYRLKQLQHQRNGHQCTDGASQIGEHHHQQNTRQLVFPETLDGQNIFWQAFHVQNLGSAGKSFHET